MKQKRIANRVINRIKNDKKTIKLLRLEFILHIVIKLFADLLLSNLQNLWLSKFIYYLVLN
jgi:hypothetical protein